MQQKMGSAFTAPSHTQAGRMLANTAAEERDYCLVNVAAERSSDNNEQNKQDNEQRKAMAMPSAHPVHLPAKSTIEYAVREREE